MKKLKFLAIAASVLLLSTPLTSNAAVAINQKSNGASFEIKDVIDYANAYGIQSNDCITRIPVKLNITDNMSTSLVVELDSRAERASGTYNFTVSGNFYRTSDHETVSVYGLSGSFEYTGRNTSFHPSVHIYLLFITNTL